MARGLDKKVLLFADEHGTPGETDFGFGFVCVRARDAQRVSFGFERYLSKQRSSEFRSANLPPTRRAEIVRAVHENLDDSVSVSFSVSKAPAQRASDFQSDGTRKGLYLGFFEQACRRTLAALQRGGKFGRMDNVELIVDRNSLNEDTAFQTGLLAEYGRLRAVRHVAVIDSAASRLLQLSDAVASMLNSSVPGSERADVLEYRTGVRTF